MNPVHFVSQQDPLWEQIENLASDMAGEAVEEALQRAGIVLRYSHYLHINYSPLSATVAGLWWMIFASLGVPVGAEALGSYA